MQCLVKEELQGAFQTGKCISGQVTFLADYWTSSESTTTISSCPVTSGVTSSEAGRIRPFEVTVTMALHDGNSCGILHWQSHAKMVGLGVGMLTTSSAGNEVSCQPDTPTQAALTGESRELSIPGTGLHSSNATSKGPIKCSQDW